MRSTDEVYKSLAYDGAPLLRVLLCISWAFLVNIHQLVNQSVNHRYRSSMHVCFVKQLHL